ncbi:hypothetical protein H0H93_000709, partial [Arthromyces matolae]
MVPNMTSQDNVHVPQCALPVDPLYLLSFDHILSAKKMPKPSAHHAASRSSSKSTADYVRAISTPSQSSLHLPRRLLSTAPGSPNNLFEYTSGSWIVNNDLRHAERKHEFDDNELRRLAAHSVGRTHHDVKTMEKLDEGGFNRIFLITMHDG